MRIKNPYVILALLSGLNLVNYLDRSLVSAVGPKLQQDLGLSDVQFGVVIQAFMLGYFATRPFFGALGDRFRRRELIALGVATWCLATAGSGLMKTFATMVAARVVVGVGEASYATLAPTIIDDLAAPSAKNRWLAVFYVAIPVGSALGCCSRSSRFSSKSRHVPAPKTRPPSALDPPSPVFSVSSSIETPSSAMP